LAAIQRSTIDPDHVAATLAEFSELWDVLYPQEKTLLVHLLVGRVVYDGDGDGDGVRVVFRPPGFQTLAPDPDRVSSVSH
jgi:hypothetical protein